jgi:tetratricopeptide (TPR) repeat protein
LLLGLVMGLLLNVRANAGILIPAMLVGGLWYMHRGRTEKAAMAAAASLFIIGLAVTAGPFVLHNWSVSGRPSLTTPQTGRALYSNNNPGNPTPYYRPTPFALAKPRLLAVQFTIEASRLSGRTLTPAEASRFWTAEVLNWAAKEPEAFARKQGYKLLALFNRNEMGDHYHIGCTGRFARFFSLPWLCFALLLPLGLGGAVLTWGRCSRCRALCLFAGLYGLTLVVFFINTRYRLPLMVVLIPLAAAGLLEFGRAVLNRRGRKVAVYLAVALVAVLVEFIPVPGAGDMTPYINSYAMSLYNAGRVDEAAVYWRRSVAADGAYSDYARISLASEALKAGNEETAWNMLLRVPDHSFVAALKYRLMGDILAGLGRPEKAVPYYSKSLQINAGQVEVRQNLIQALRKTDPAAAARQENTLRNILYFYEKAGLIE